MSVRAIPVTAFVLMSCGAQTVAPVETIDVSNAEVVQCIAEWDSYVDAWNDLTVIRDNNGLSDVVVDGVTYTTYAEWATVNGYPLTYEELCP